MDSCYFSSDLADSRSPLQRCHPPVHPDEEAREALRLEILNRIKERQFYGSLNKHLEVSEQKMGKSQLFRRMQAEKEERRLQECLCKEEQERCKRERQNLQEENFAQAIKELKEDEVRESAFRKQLYSCAPEIRDLEHELRRAYYAKTLYAQRLEGEAKLLEEKMRQQENYDLLLDKLREVDEAEEAVAIAEAQKKRDYNTALRNQLQDASSKEAKKMGEAQKDKEMVDEIVATIEKEEIQDLTEKVEKIKLFRSEIKHYLDSREYHREREKARAKEEEAKIQQFIHTKEEQMNEFGKAKAERDAKKAAIVAKAIDSIMKDQFKNEELEDLRRELYEEELAESVRRKEAEEKERKTRQMKELQAAEAEAKRLRAEKLQADRKEEEEYRAQLVAKFAEDDRLEQLSNEKRRRKEIEHRRKIEDMILERRALKAQAREREQESRHCFDEETIRRKTLIEEERLKLLREHGPKLLGFIPRGVIKSKEELTKLGEPFISYYTNQPRQPHPTTIDVDPCEEEIFKNMKVPPYAKF